MTNGGGLQPKTDRRTLMTFAIAVPAIVIFATGLLGMNFLMALILGAIIGARILFPTDRRVLVGVIVAAIVWAILLPFMHDEGGDFMNIATLILAYSVMALGLNIIVGYAGLLDLGYVAFFALGALTAGWFMSDFYANAGEGENGIHVLVADVTQGLFGIHFNFLIVVVIAIVITTIAGMLDRPADAPAARRLHRDRDPRVRRDRRAHRHQRRPDPLQGRPDLGRDAHGRIR